MPVKAASDGVEALAKRKQMPVAISEPEVGKHALARSTAD
jgi:hypothetical protein